MTADEKEKIYEARLTYLEIKLADQESALHTIFAEIGKRLARLEGAFFLVIVFLLVLLTAYSKSAIIH